jgi:hypothetical protein
LDAEYYGPSQNYLKYQLQIVQVDELKDAKHILNLVKERKDKSESEQEFTNDIYD